jgi:centromeric protein E
MSAAPATKRAVSNENISVAIRVRPLIEKEVSEGEVPAWQVEADAKCLVQTERSNKKKKKSHQQVPLQEFPFNHVLDQDATTGDVFKTSVSGLVSSAMEGVNGTIFAYGQTSSGKTHTIKGTPSDPGIIARSMYQVFESIRENQVQS